MVITFAFAYLADILIFSHYFMEHVQHVILFLQRLLENRLYVKAKKCYFHATSVNFLGYVIRRRVVWADPAKVKAIADESLFLPTENNDSKVANFNKRLICNYTSLAAPLKQLTSIKHPRVCSAPTEKTISRLR